MEDIIKFYAAQGWDWRLPVLFHVWNEAGRPMNHWTLQAARQIDL